MIEKAIDEEIQVISIPGPSAFVSALSLSGLSTDEFTFTGFLPVKKNQRMKILKDLSLEPRTLIFYEAPHRILETLIEMEDIFKERKAAVIKEITKIHEEVVRGDISEILAELENTMIAGEYVIIIEGRKQEKILPTEDIFLEINNLMKKGLRRKDAVKRIAETYGLSKKELYDRSLNEIP